MSRKPIIAGNWKMNMLQADARDLFMGVAKHAEKYTVEQLPTIVIAPTFTSIAAVEGMRCDKCRPLVKTAAQNCHWEKSGAYTGEISVEMAQPVEFLALCIVHAGSKPNHIVVGTTDREDREEEEDEKEGLHKRVFWGKRHQEGGGITISHSVTGRSSREANGRKFMNYF